MSAKYGSVPALRQNRARCRDFEYDGTYFRSSKTFRDRSWDDKNSTTATLTSKTERDDALIGGICMITAIVLSGFATYLIKYSFVWNHDITALNFYIVNSSVMVVISIIEAMTSKADIFKIQKGGCRWLLAKCALSVFSNIIFFISFHALSLDEMEFLFFYYPVFICVSSVYFVGTTINKRQAVMIVLLFAGGLLMNISKIRITYDNLSNSITLTCFGVFLCCGAIVLSVLVSISAKQTSKYFHIIFSTTCYTITNYLFVISLAIVCPAMFNFAYVKLDDYIRFSAATCLYYICGIFISLATQKASTSLCNPFSYSFGIILMIVDITVVQYAITITDITGILLIVAITLGSFVFSRQLNLETREKDKTD